jgi:hypothetical protein
MTGGSSGSMTCGKTDRGEFDAHSTLRGVPPVSGVVTRRYGLARGRCAAGCIGGWAVGARFSAPLLRGSYYAAAQRGSAATACRGKVAV